MEIKGLPWTYHIDKCWYGYVICIDDPETHRPAELESVYNGKYAWKRSGHGYSKAIAEKHLKNLRNGADKDWIAFHNSWAEYNAELREKEAKKAMKGA